MFNKGSFSRFNVMRDLLKIAHITFRVKWIRRYFKWYTFFSCHFFSKIVNAALIESPMSEQAVSMPFFTSASSLKFTFTVCPI